MDFSEKIDKILSTNTLGVSSISALEDYCGISRSTVTRLYNGETVNGLKTEKKILEKLRINKRWWETGEEPIYMFDEKKITMSNPDPKIPEQVYRDFPDFIEKTSVYFLIPKTILEEEYRIMLKSDIDKKDQMLREIVEAKNDLIKELREEIADLRSTQRAVPAKQA